MIGGQIYFDSFAIGEQFQVTNSSPAPDGQDIPGCQRLLKLWRVAIPINFGNYEFLKRIQIYQNPSNRIFYYNGWIANEIAPTTPVLPLVPGVANKDS